ncbi:hypothetical protein KKA14_17935, partial [bacterium]|nr:hypothetical protein [bacterium]
MKKVFTWIIGILVVFGLASFLLVNSWADTGHGKLNYKVAIVLKLMEITGAEPADESERPSVAEGREKMLKTVETYSAGPVDLPKIINQTIPGLKGNIPIRIYIP